MTSPGSVWVIGDVQGCYAPLQQLLAHPQIAQDTNARFWFAGDLINRGPDSLGAIRTVMQLGDRAVTVLGNHDLHLLGVVAGARRAGKSDTLQDILQAPDADDIVHWLRHRPLAHFDRGHLLVHAGILPQWTVSQTLSLASEVEAVLRGPDWTTHLQSMYGNEPSRWRDDLTGPARMRVIINALTRLRMCTADGVMDFKHKGEPGRDGDLMPWFDVPGRAAAADTVVFGHWSTLGLMLRPDAICLDTGCVWGRQLTALRLGDRECVQVACRQYKDPLHH